MKKVRSLQKVLFPCSFDIPLVKKTPDGQGDGTMTDTPTATDTGGGHGAKTLRREKRSFRVEPKLTLTTDIVQKRSVFLHDKLVITTRLGL
jgi:hypothetical protein